MPLSPDALLLAWKAAHAFQHPWAHDGARALLEEWSAARRLPGWRGWPRDPAYPVTTDPWFEQLRCTPPDPSVPADQCAPEPRDGQVACVSVPGLSWYATGTADFSTSWILLCVELTPQESTTATVLVGWNRPQLVIVDRLTPTEDHRPALARLLPLLDTLVEDRTVLDAALAETFQGEWLVFVRDVLAEHAVAVRG